MLRFRRRGNSVLRKYKDAVTGCRYAEISDLSFISDKQSCYNWLQRHWLSFRCKRACKKADLVVARSNDVAVGLVRYYFVPKAKIVLSPAKDALSDKAE